MLVKVFKVKRIFNTYTTKPTSNLILLSSSRMLIIKIEPPLSKTTPEDKNKEEFFRVAKSSFKSLVHTIKDAYKFSFKRACHVNRINRMSFQSF